MPSGRTEQEKIRDEWADITRDITRCEEKITKLETELGELQQRCTHPMMGRGFNCQGFKAEPNECPDCGFHKES